MDHPAIVGVYEGALDAGGRPVLDIAATAAAGALRDAGLTLADVDGVFAAYAWEEPSIMFASEVANTLGVEPRYVETVSFGGASPAIMVARAAQAIRDGLCEVALLVAASNRASRIGSAGAIAALRDVLSPEFEVQYGAFVPPVYGLTATRHMHEFGTTPEQLAAVAVMQRANAALQPAAAHRTPLTIADVLSSPLVATPLHRYDCCLVTDFEGAIVMVAADRVRDATRAVDVLGTGEAHDLLSSSAVPSLTSRGASRSGPLALERSGIDLADLDVAELYDSFTITVLLTLEDLGLAPKGEAGAMVERGDFHPGAALPINTNGGMLSYRTGGISHVIEAVHQVRGEARGVAVDGARHALVHGIGGAMSSHGTLVLGGAGR